MLGISDALRQTCKQTLTSREPHSGPHQDLFSCRILLTVRKSASVNVTSADCHRRVAIDREGGPERHALSAPEWSRSVCYREKETRDVAAELR